MGKEIGIEYLRKKVKELEEAIHLGLPFEEKLMLSFFKNLTENISIWACKGSSENFEIVFWNKGAEKIYGYSSEEATGKNCTELFMCEAEREVAKDDIDRIISGIPFHNMIAHDINRNGEQVIIITNTFRIENFDSRRGFLQAEIGVDVSELEEFKAYRSLDQVHARLLLLENLIDSLSAIDEFATETNSLYDLLKMVVDRIAIDFGNGVILLAVTTENTNLNISNFVYSNTQIDNNLQIEIGNFFDRSRRTTPYFENTFIAIPLLPPKSRIRVGFVYLSLPDSTVLNEQEKWILERIAKHVLFAFKYVFLS